MGKATASGPAAHGMATSWSQITLSVVRTKPARGLAPGSLLSAGRRRKPGRFGRRGRGSLGRSRGPHAHTGDEHHVVLSGRWRMSQGEHVVELGLGDYLRWDGSVPHDAEVMGLDEGRLLIITLAPG